MDMESECHAEIFSYFEKRILNGWILVTGSMESFKDLENKIYPPSTEENKYFELASFPVSGAIVTVAVVKKTQRLWRAFGQDKDFPKIIMIDFVDQECKHGTYRAITIKYPGKKDGFRQFVRLRLNELFSRFEEIMTSEKDLMTKEELWKKFTENEHKNKPKKQRKHISKSIRHEVFKRDDYKCVECGASNKETRLHIDHIVPVAQGGSDELDNLQTLCEDCNLAKSDRKWKGGLKD